MVRWSEGVDGEMSRSFAWGERLKERLEEWERGDEVFLVDELPHTPAKLFTFSQRSLSTKWDTAISRRFPVMQGVVYSVRCQACSPVQSCRHSWAHLTLVPTPALRRRSPSLWLMGRTDQ